MLIPTKYNRCWLLPLTWILVSTGYLFVHSGKFISQMKAQSRSLAYKIRSKSSIYSAHTAESSKLKYLNKTSFEVEISSLSEKAIYNYSYLDVTNFTVAIVLALTSAGHSETRFYKGPLFTAFIPSFCKTASKNISYTLYVSHDFSDKMFNSLEKLETFRRKVDETANKCVQLELEFVKCSHQNHPAWAQNDGALAAYRHGHDFFYRVNDDTIFVSENWTLIFIEELRKMKPPLLGVVGPNHKGGNTAILTYDFVHRTHIDLFGFHYPREFTDWYADAWISQVYRPHNYMKIKSIRLIHTMKFGRRYRLRAIKDLRVVERDALARGKRLVEVEKLSRERKYFSFGRKVIAFLANSTADDVIHGLLRNINLARFWFPTWTVHISVNEAVYSNKTKLLELMRLKGADIEKSVFLNTDLLRSLIEKPHVEYLLLRHPLTRLSRTESSLTMKWIRDHQRQNATRVSSSYEMEKIAPCWANIKTKNIKVFSSKLVNYSMGNYLLKLMQEVPSDVSAYGTCTFVTEKYSTFQEQQFLDQRFDKHELQIDKLSSGNITQVCQDDYSSYSDVEFFETVANAYQKL